MIRFLLQITAAFVLALSTGCASRYVTPGAAVNLDAINDYTIEQRFKTKPAAPFPARMAVVRVQQAGYRSYRNNAYGHGRYSVVMTRDMEQDEHFEKLSALPEMDGLASLNRLLLPEKLENIKDLRRACAGLHADLLLVYTVDTSFRIKENGIGPFGVITLGTLPTKEPKIISTASAALYDVRTGYIYGLAEATHRSSHVASAWTKDSVVDNARVNTEKEAFSKLVDEFAGVWEGVVEEYGRVDGDGDGAG